MKRMISLMLVVMFLCSLVPYSFAENEEFDYKTVLGNLEGYSYDKFDKCWSYYGAYAEYFSDATLVVGIRAGSESNESAPALTTLYVKIMDQRGDKLYDAESIDFLIGDDIYSYESMLPGDTSSSVVIAQDGLLLLEAINNSNVSDVAIRVGIKNRGSMTLDDLDSSEYSELKEFCRVYLKYNIWDYTADKDSANLYESFFPLTINGERVEHEESEAA